jgi:hypothetical protein
LIDIDFLSILRHFRFSLFAASITLMIFLSPDFSRRHDAAIGHWYYAATLFRHAVIFIIAFIILILHFHRHYAFIIFSFSSCH